MSEILHSIEDIQHMASMHDAVVVACSFGKDSLVVLDLCYKHFQRVEAFCMTFVPGLSVVQEKIEYARQRWGVEVREVEHWAAVQQRAKGYRCFPSQTVDKLPTMTTFFEQMKREYGIPLIATGTRAAESIGRRAGLLRSERGQTAGAWPGWHPIAWWTRSDVVGYLRNHDLPLDGINADMQGWSLEASSILKLYDCHREDYEKLVDAWPLASCVVTRRELYGVMQ